MTIVVSNKGLDQPAASRLQVTPDVGLRRETDANQED